MNGPHMPDTQQWALVFGTIWCLAFLLQLVSDVSYKGMRVREVFTKDHLKGTARYITTIVLVMLISTAVWLLVGVK